MKHILSIAFAQDHYNFDEEIEFFGDLYRITQYSTNYDIELTENIIKKYDGLCDVISISGLPQKIKFKKGFFIHPDTYRLKVAAKFTPIVDGQIIKDVYIPYALRLFYLKNKNVLSNKKIGLYSAALQKPFVEVLEDLENELVMADPYFLMKMPFNLHSSQSLEKFIKTLSPVLKRLKIKKGNVPTFSEDVLMMNGALEEFLTCDIFVGNEANINFLNLDHLKGKTLIIDIVSPTFEEKLKKAGLKEALICLPQLTSYSKINYSILEGIVQLKKGIGNPVKDDDVVDLVDELKLSPELRKMNESEVELVTFSFVIHPLSSSYLLKHPLFKYVNKTYAKFFEKGIEEVMSISPGFYYGKIDGIVSEKNGQKVEGLIYAVTETPKKLMQKEADVIYRKILKLCDKAYQAGSQIMGLGAYTKIVGDAGVTIDHLSPIPVTTGNSLSSASTLWAAKLAVEKLGFVPKSENKFLGTVMVVGATGSIGAVSAKILALTWKNLVLVAPRAYKLLELKEEILKINPHVQITVSTEADSHSHESDLIITTTSGQGKTILDIMKVKAGCVICDVSRPFDISEVEAIKRPDVLVIASGEVQLPGQDVKIDHDIGLEGNIVYACLAETALLAMEGKFESFTLSRNIDYAKVIEIDKLAHEHGVRLSQIMGHNGFITEEEFSLCREHALLKLKQVKRDYRNDGKLL
jgi:predicted amino acid dehydrogenase